jgi:subtilisin
MTDSKGELKLMLPKNQKQKALLRVEPAHSYWPAALAGLKWTKSETFDVTCPAIDGSVTDSLRFIGGAGAPHDGKGVVVAVIDGGAGPHEGLPDFTGRNFSNPSRPTDVITDNGIGHGTHVAGIIAGKSGSRSLPGMAPGVTLRVYRVYAQNGLTTGGFSVASAIQAAVDGGADIINLSLTLPVADLAVIRQIQRARARGVVCVAAAGNTGGAVMMPASHDSVIGVSAVGCKGCWPNGASHTLDIRESPKGKNPKHFTAKFSCFGSEIDLTGPGVGIVSLFPKNRLAVFNGTSMAAPAVSGLIARRLAKAPAILGMPRDQARSDQIVALALEAATPLGFPARHQGRGILT